MRAVAALMLVAACTRGDVPKVGPAPETAHAPADAPGLPEVRTMEDVLKWDKQRAVVVGRYDVERVSAHRKGGRITWIVLGDGTLVARAYAPIQAELGFVDRRVRVTGTVTKGPPDAKVQALGGPHVHLESIVLEGGGQPAPAATLPTPPEVASAKEFDEHVGRWVALDGKVEPFATKSSAFMDVTVSLSDGQTVCIDAGWPPEWKPLVGARVTVLGNAAAKNGKRVLYFAGPPCAGHEPRCGMDVKDP